MDLETIKNKLINGLFYIINLYFFQYFTEENKPNFLSKNKEYFIKNNKNLTQFEHFF